MDALLDALAGSWGSIVATAAMHPVCAPRTLLDCHRLARKLTLVVAAGRDKVQDTGEQVAWLVLLARGA